MTLAELVVKIGADVSGFDGKIDGVNKKARALGQELTTIGTGLTAGVTVPLVGIAAAALKAAGDFEQTTIAFNTMLGSAEKATAFLTELEAFAKNTPFEFTGLTEASKRLLAMGFDAEELIPTMTAVGNAVAGIGGGQQGIDRVTTALGQMQAKGKVSAEEMKQLTEAGIPAWEFLAKTLKTDVAGAMELVTKRAVESGPAIAGLIEGMNEKFGGLMDAQSKTILGQFSNLKDELGFILRDFGAGLKPAAQDAMDAIMPLTAELGKMAEAFRDAEPETQKWATGVGVAAAAVGPLLIGLGQLVNLSASSWKGLSALGAGIGTIATGPMAAWIAAGYLMVEQLALISKGSEGLVRWLSELVGIDFDAAMKRNTDEFDAFLRSMGLMSDESENVKSDYSALIKGSDAYLASLVAANEKLKTTSSAMGDVEKAARAMASAGKVVDDFLDSMADKAEHAVRSAQSLSEMLTVINDNALSETFKGQKEALDDLGGSMADIGPVASQVGDDLKDIFNSELPEGVKEYGDELEQTGERMKQFSTIVTDFGRNVAEGFVGLFSGDRGDFNASLDQKADDLRAALDRERNDLEESLGDRADAYREFVADVAESTAEITSDHAEKLADQLENFRDNLADRQQSFDRFVADHSKSLKRLTEDYADSLADQDRDQAQAMAQRQLRYDRDVADAKKSHDRKVSDLEKALALEIAKGVDANHRRIADIRESLREENEDYRIAMERRAEDFRIFQEQQKADRAEFEAELRERTERATEDLQTALERREADHQAHVAEIQAQMAEAVEASKKSEAEKLAALQESLDKQTSAYEKFKASALAEYEALKADTNAKLDEMAGKHRTVLGDIGALFGTVFKEAGVAVTRFVVEELVGKLFKELNVLDGILGGLKKVFGEIFGIGGGAAGSVAGSAGSAAGSAGGGAAGAAGQVGGMAASGVVGIVTGAVSAVSGVIGNFQFAGMNKSLDLIVNHTLRIFNVLDKEQRIQSENLVYITASTDDMKASLWEIAAILRGGGGGGVVLAASTVTEVATKTGAAVSSGVVDGLHITVSNAQLASDASVTMPNFPDGVIGTRPPGQRPSRGRTGFDERSDIRDFDLGETPFSGFSNTGPADAASRTSGPVDRPLSELEKHWAELRAFGDETRSGAMGGGGFGSASSLIGPLTDLSFIMGEVRDRCADIVDKVNITNETQDASFTEIIQLLKAVRDKNPIITIEVDGEELARTTLAKSNSLVGGY